MNMLFWFSTIVTIVLLVGFILWSKSQPSVSSRLIAAINHILLLCLPVVVATHGAKYCNIVLTANIMNVLSVLEQLVFPLYVGVLVMHVKVNWEFFKKPCE